MGFNCADLIVCFGFSWLVFSFCYFFPGVGGGKERRVRKVC
jgi:hypothetical protein